MSKARVIGPFLLGLLILLGAWLPEGALPVRAHLLVAGAVIWALGATAARVAGVLLPEAGWLARAVIAFEVAVAVVVVPATWLGHFGHLSPRALLFWVVVAFLLTRLFAAPAPASGVASPVGIGAIPSRLEKGERFLLAIAVWAFLTLLAATVIRYRYAAPGEIHFDDSSYHLSAVAAWRSFGDLRMMKFPVGDTAMTFFPVAGELFSFFLLSLVSPSDFLARWSELPFAVFSLVGVAALAVQLGLGRRSALLAALFFGLTRRFFVNGPLMLSAGTDLATAFHVLATILAALLLVERPGWRRAIVAGLPLGLLIGTKYTGVLFSAPLGILLLSCLAAGAWREKPARWGRALTLLALLSAVALVVGGYTYLRNAVTAGNPLFPAPVKLLGHDLFPGWPSVNPEAWKADPVHALEPWGFLWKRIDLFGPIFRVTLLPAALLAPLVAIVLALRRRERLVTAILMALPIALYIEFVFLMNDHRENRYFAAAPALASVALFWLLARAGKGAQNAVHVAGAAAVIACVFATTPADTLSSGPVWIGAAALAGAAATLAAGLLGRRPIPAARLALAAFAIFLLFGPLPLMIKRFESDRYSEKRVAAEVDRRTQGKGAVIAYAGWNQPYPYFGSHLQNRVEFVPTTSRGPSPYYTWRGDAKIGPSGGSLVEWLRNLRSAGVGYVVAEGPPSGSLEATWVALFRDAIVPLAFDGWAVLSQVREGSEAKPPRLALLAESDAAGSFLDKRTGLGRDAAAAGKPAFVIPAAGGGFLFPPTGHQFQWLRIELASGPAPPEPVAVRINGQEAGRLPPASSAGKIRFGIPAGAWSEDGNAIELSPVGVGKRPDARARIGATEIETRTPLSAESSGFWAGSRAVLRAGTEKVVRSGSGYHLALLSPELDRIVHVRSFDTCGSHEASNELSTFVEGLAPGTVVLGAVSDDGSRSLSARAVAALESLGCAVDLRDRFRQGHAFIGVKGAAKGTVPEWSGLSPSRVVAGPELVRVAALELFSGAGPEAKALDPLPWTPAGRPLAPHALYRVDASLVGSIDVPAENAVVTGLLRVSGWARIPGEDLHVTITLDGEERSAARDARVPRPDVQAAVPSLGDCRSAGYDATYAFEPGDEGPHEIQVLFRASDGRQRHYPPRRFTWKR